MKLLTFVFINFALFTFTGVVVAQGKVEKVDVCAGLTCSGHGSCVDVSGNPVCACDEGYRTDPESKLGCLPLQIAVPVIVNPQQPSGSLLSLADYDAAIEQRKGGNAMMFFGITSLAASLTFLTILAWEPEDGAQYNCSDDDGCTTHERDNGKIVGLSVATIATLGLGLGLTIPGIMKRRRWGRVMRQFEIQQKTPIASRISPVFSLNPRYQGAGLRVSF